MKAKYEHKDIKTLATGIDHSEGLCVGLQGEIYLGSESGKIYRLTLDGIFDVVAQSRAGGILLGLSIRSNGNLLVCDAAAKTIWEVNLESQTWEVFCNSVDGNALILPNWGCFLPDGSYIFSDSGDWKKSEGTIVRVDTSGISSIWSKKFPDFPNGIALSEDGLLLYIIESSPGKLSSISINSDCSAGDIKVLKQMDAVPDGVTVTASGALVISCYRPDVIYLWDKTGLSVLAEDIEGTFVAAPTNTVLTGPNRNLLVWPNFGRWDVAQIETNLRGIPLLIF
jgi:gluconolactonase